METRTEKKSFQWSLDRREFLEREIVREVQKSNRVGWTAGAASRIKKLITEIVEIEDTIEDAIETYESYIAVAK